MGRRNKAYVKDLHQQAYDQLTGMQAFGQSKTEAMACLLYTSPSPRD